MRQLKPYKPLNAKLTKILSTWKDLLMLILKNLIRCSKLSWYSQFNLDALQSQQPHLHQLMSIIEDSILLIPLLHLLTLFSFWRRSHAKIQQERPFWLDKGLLNTWTEFLNASKIRFGHPYTKITMESWLNSSKHLLSQYIKLNLKHCQPDSQHIRNHEDNYNDLKHCFQSLPHNSSKFDPASSVQKNPSQIPLNLLAQNFGQATNRCELKNSKGKRPLLQLWWEIYPKS